MAAPATSAAIALANLQNKCDPSRFEQTSHISFDAKGNLYLADSNNQRIRRIDPAGIITTIAGDGAAPAANCAAFPAASPHLFNPADVLPLPNGNLVVADQQNNRILQISPTGTVTTIAGNGVHNLFVPGNPATASPDGLARRSRRRFRRPDLLLRTPQQPHRPHQRRWQTRHRRRQRFPRHRHPHQAHRHRHRPRWQRPHRRHRQSPHPQSRAQRNPHHHRRHRHAVLLRRRRTRPQPPASIPRWTSSWTAAAISTSPTRATTASAASTPPPATSPPSPPALLNTPCAIALDANDNLYIVDWQNFVIRKVAFPAISPGGIVDGASFSAPPAPGGIFSHLRRQPLHRHRVLQHRPVAHHARRREPRNQRRRRPALPRLPGTDQRATALRHARPAPPPPSS